MSNHRQAVEKWRDRMRVTWMAFADMAEARRAERTMIRATEPVWNRTGFGYGRRAAELVDEWFDQNSISD